MKIVDSRYIQKLWFQELSSFLFWGIILMCCFLSSFFKIQSCNCTKLKIHFHPMRKKSYDLILKGEHKE